MSEKKNLIKPGAGAEITARLNKLTPHTQRLWGRMTAHQMICHLNDSQRCAMGELPVTDRSNAFSRSVMKFVALWVPMKWPKGIPTVPEIDQAAGGGTRPLDFDNDRKTLLQLLDRFSAQRRDFHFATHAIFGEMTEEEWMRWSYLHCDHHLRQFGL